MARPPAAATVSRLRLLAHQPAILPDPNRDAARNSDRQLCMVPLGRSAVGIPPADPARAGFAAGVLGSHRVRLRARLDSSQTCPRNCGSIGRPAGNLSGHAGSSLHPHARQTMDETTYYAASLRRTSLLDRFCYPKINL